MMRQKSLSKWLVKKRNPLPTPNNLVTWYNAARSTIKACLTWFRSKRRFEWSMAASLIWTRLRSTSRGHRREHLKSTSSKTLAPYGTSTFSNATTRAAKCSFASGITFSTIYVRTRESAHLFATDQAAGRHSHRKQIWQNTKSCTLKTKRRSNVKNAVQDLKIITSSR